MPGKKCRKCLETKPETEFYVRKDSGNLRSECKACMRARSLEAYARNPGEKRRQIQGWIDRNIDLHRSYNRKSQKKRKQRKEVRQAIYAHRWGKYRLVMYESNARRRAREMGAHTEKVSYQEILDRDNGMCHICREWVDEDEREFDHVIPLARGGPHTEDNIRLSHRSCNRAKGARYAG